MLCRSGKLSYFCIPLRRRREGEKERVRGIEKGNRLAKQTEAIKSFRNIKKSLQVLKSFLPLQPATEVTTEGKQREEEERELKSGNQRNFKRV